jgi:hypothetical protein
MNGEETADKWSPYREELTQELKSLLRHMLDVERAGNDLVGDIIHGRALQDLKDTRYGLLQPVGGVRNRLRDLFNRNREYRLSYLTREIHSYIFDMVSLEDEPLNAYVIRTRDGLVNLIVELLEQLGSYDSEAKALVGQFTPSEPWQPHTE